MARFGELSALVPSSAKKFTRWKDADTPILKQAKTEYARLH